MTNTCPETKEFCRIKPSVYKDRQHILRCSPNEKILGTPAQFCRAFYHVSKKGKELFCLKPHCTYREPKTAVALVRYEDKDGQILFLKRYTNCSSSKMHAEEFFSRDINWSLSGDVHLINALYDDMTIKKITMFITMQPCHLSTLGTRGTHDDQSCCRIIAEALVGLPDDVKICIKPTHLCKVRWKKKQNPNEQQERRNLCISHAEIGIKALMRISRVLVSAMEPQDWEFLWHYVEFRPNISDHDVMKRKNLDKKIETVLEQLNNEIHWENVLLDLVNMDDEELFFKALCEMKNCNRNMEKAGPCFSNLAAIMEHVKRKYGYLGDENGRVDSEFTFVFKKMCGVLTISWDKDTKVLKKVFTPK